MTFETGKSLKQEKERARSRWDMWRLVIDAKMDYNTVFWQMTPGEIAEANAALDLYIEAVKNANNKKR